MHCMFRPTVALIKCAEIRGNFRAFHVTAIGEFIATILSEVSADLSALQTSEGTDTPETQHMRHRIRKCFDCIINTNTDLSNKKGTAVRSLNFSAHDDCPRPKHITQ
jgi:hypothetical protein